MAFQTKTTFRSRTVPRLSVPPTPPTAKFNRRNPMPTELHNTYLKKTVVTRRTSAKRSQYMIVSPNRGASWWFSPKAKTEKPHNISWPNATYSWLAGGSKECQRHSRVEPCRLKPNAMQWPTRERRRCAGPQLVHRMVHGWHNVNCQMENREFYKHFINIQMSNVWTWCSPHGWMTWRHKSVVPQWHSNFLPNRHLPSNLSSKSDT